MKLGIAYNSFDGLELLEYAIKSIRSEIDFICLIRQKVSYHGNQVDPIDLMLIEKLNKNGLVDLVVDYTPNLSLTPRENETIIRNLGLDQSIADGCSHHISADVDEFYLPEELKYAKEIIGGFDCSVAESLDYFKNPTWKIIPERRHLISLIHPIESRYEMNMNFPYPIDITRRSDKCNKCLILDPNKFLIHHMCYVRNDIRKKVANNMNHKNKIKLDFCDKFDKYQLGDRLCIPPDYMNRKTIEVANLFNIKESNGRIIINRS